MTGFLCEDFLALNSLCLVIRTSLFFTSRRALFTSETYFLLPGRQSPSCLGCFFLPIYLLIYFWRCRVLSVAHRLSPAALVAGGGLPLRPAAQLQNAGSRRTRSVLVSTGLVAPEHVESSGTRYRTHVSCIGRRIIYL